MFQQAPEIRLVQSDKFPISHFQSKPSLKAEAFAEAFLKNGIQQNPKCDLKSMMSHKAVVLDFTRPKKEKKSCKKAKGLNACQKRAMKIYEIKPEHQRLVINMKDWALCYVQDVAQCRFNNTFLYTQLLTQFHDILILTVDTNSSSLCISSGGSTLLTCVVGWNQQGKSFWSFTDVNTDILLV